MELARSDHSVKHRYFPLAVIVLIVATIAVFAQALRFDFISADTTEQVLENPYIRGLTAGNIHRIFTSRCTFSYYPLRTLTYALDYQFWGYRPTGFKLTNLLIHLVNIWLVYALVRKLLESTRDGPRASSVWDVAVACVTAGLLALHPVVVEPVVWIPGREELLMTLGALACFHFHLKARRAASEDPSLLRVWRWHAASAAAMTCACLSNAVAAVIPALITAWELYCYRPRSWRSILYRTAALWLLGAATIVVKWYTEVDHGVAYARVFSADWAMLILCMYWLNLKTLLWPAELVIHYDWPDLAGFTEVPVWLGAVAIFATVLALYLARRRLLVAFGLTWFVLALAPAAQLMPHHIARADRFLYLPLVGLVIAVAGLLQPLGRSAVSPVIRLVSVGAGIGVLVVLGVRSHLQIPTWRDDMAVWSHCVQVQPANAYAHSRVAKQLARSGLFEQAAREYTLAIRLRPDHADTLADAAVLFATAGDPDFRDFELAVGLAEEASERTGGTAERIQRKLAMVHSVYADQLAVKQDFEAAAREYRRAIQADATFDTPRFNLALLLITCPDRSLRRPDEAIRHAKRGCEVAETVDAHRLAILAAAYAQAGQFREAISGIRQAIRAAQFDGDVELEQELYVMLKLYRQGQTVETATVDNQ